MSEGQTNARGAIAAGTDRRFRWHRRLVRQASLGTTRLARGSAGFASLVGRPLSVRSVFGEFSRVDPDPVAMAEVRPLSNPFLSMWRAQRSTIGDRSAPRIERSGLPYAGVLPRVTKGVQAGFAPGSGLARLQRDVLAVRLIPEVAAVGSVLTQRERRYLGGVIRQRGTQTAQPQRFEPAVVAPNVQGASQGAGMEVDTAQAAKVQEHQSTKPDAGGSQAGNPSGVVEGSASGRMIRSSTSPISTRPVGEPTGESGGLSSGFVGTESKAQEAASLLPGANGSMMRSGDGVHSAREVQDVLRSPSGPALLPTTATGGGVALDHRPPVDRDRPANASLLAVSMMLLGHLGDQFLQVKAAQEGVSHINVAGPFWQYSNRFPRANFRIGSRPSERASMYLQRSALGFAGGTRQALSPRSSPAGPSRGGSGTLGTSLSPGSLGEPNRDRSGMSKLGFAESGLAGGRRSRYLARVGLASRGPEPSAGRASAKVWGDRDNVTGRGVVAAGEDRFLSQQTRGGRRSFVRPSTRLARGFATSNPGRHDGSSGVLSSGWLLPRSLGLFMPGGAGDPMAQNTSVLLRSGYRGIEVGPGQLRSSLRELWPMVQRSGYLESVPLLGGQSGGPRPSYVLRRVGPRAETAVDAVHIPRRSSALRMSDATSRGASGATGAAGIPSRGKMLTGRHAGEAFEVAVDQESRERSRSLPAALVPLAKALGIGETVEVRTGMATRRALRQVSKEAATFRGVIHLNRDVDNSAQTLGVLAHELVHVREQLKRPQGAPRFYQDQHFDHEEARARRVGDLVTSLVGESADERGVGSGGGSSTVASLPVVAKGLISTGSRGQPPGFPTPTQPVTQEAPQASGHESAEGLTSLFEQFHKAQQRQPNRVVSSPDVVASGLKEAHEAIVVADAPVVSVVPPIYDSHLVRTNESRWASNQNVGGSPAMSDADVVSGSSAPKAEEFLDWLVEQVERRMLREMESQGRRHMPDVL